jgi:hypothetical protein
MIILIEYAVNNCMRHHIGMTSRKHGGMVLNHNNSTAGSKYILSANDFCKAEQGPHNRHPSTIENADPHHIKKSIEN